MAPATSTYTKLATPKFVADEGSVMLHGTGVQINWASESAVDGVKRLAAGTLIHLTAAGLAEKAVETTKPAHGILVQDADDQRGQNQGMHGLYRGGIFYSNLMPEAPTATQLTELGARFVFQTYQDTRLS